MYQSIDDALRVYVPDFKTWLGKTIRRTRTAGTMLFVVFEDSTWGAVGLECYDSDDPFMTSPERFRLRPEDLMMAGIISTAAIERLRQAR